MATVSCNKKNRSSTTNTKRPIQKQVRGIEPPSPAWEAGILPMNYTCKKDGSNGARTHDLSRVRRTLIPAELCFRLLTRFILPLYQKESSPNENFCYIFSDFSPAHIRTCRYGPDGYAFGCLGWRSFASGAGAQVSISFSMSSFLT